MGVVICNPALQLGMVGAAATVDRFYCLPHDNDCFISQDSAVYQSLRVSEAEVEDDVIMQSSSSYTPVEQLERDDSSGQLPPAQHSAGGHGCC